jgi:nucleoside-diphosphate-sugar epimerase
MEPRVARYHNIFGPEGSWNNGKEKAPAALCRKVAMAKNDDEIEIWGDGKQTRSFLYIDECVEGTVRLTRSDWAGPVNIGSDFMVSISQLVDVICDVAGKVVGRRNIPGPVGVRGRNSDNNLIKKMLDWVPDTDLRKGIAPTYQWIRTQLLSNASAG